MNPHLIDYAVWPRRELFEFFRKTVVYTTVELDITGFLRRVKAAGIRFYPAVIHCLAAVVNGGDDYRYGFDEEGRVGVWDAIHPLYTVPRRDESGLFSMVSTAYDADFGAFYAAFLEDYARAEDCGRLLCDGTPARNVMGVTAMPALRFSGFAFGDPEVRPDLTPFVVLGKYEQRDGRVTLPVCGEFCHCVNDGAHITAFFKRLEEMLTDFGV